jgi:hypothetical protein
VLFKNSQLDCIGLLSHGENDHYLLTSDMTEGDGSSAKNFRSAYYEKLGFCGNDEKNYLELLIEASPFESDKLNDLCERPELDRKCIGAWKILLGVECDRKNPFDDYANVRRVRNEHFQSLKHHLEVLLKHNNLLINKSKSAPQHRQHGHDDDHHDDGNDEEEKGDDDDDDEDNNEHNNKQSTTEPHDGTCKEFNQNHQKFHHNKTHHNYQHESDHKACADANHAKLITMMYLLETGRLETLDIDGQMESEESRKLLNMATFFVNVAEDLQEAFFLFRNFTNHIRNKTAS